MVQYCVCHQSQSNDSEEKSRSDRNRKLGNVHGSCVADSIRNRHNRLSCEGTLGSWRLWANATHALERARQLDGLRGFRRPSASKDESKRVRARLVQRQRAWSVY
jgi:hypothetical protein